MVLFDRFAVSSRLIPPLLADQAGTICCYLSLRFIPPKDLKVHSGTPATHGGLPGQHQRQVKNTQIYEFYHFPKKWQNDLW